uniref:Uncharacterized protein n=1 Tax=Anguilla anguilla TaxID=7936 RepID=A0A0E9VA10_ANGAN
MLCTAYPTGVQGCEYSYLFYDPGEPL